MKTAQPQRTKSTNDTHALVAAGAGRTTMRTNRRTIDGRERMEDEAEIYAWWTAFGDDHEKSGEERAQRHVYTTQLRPTAPIELGMSVRIIALAKDKGRRKETMLERYNPYEPHIVGTVVGITRKEPGWVRITLRNECQGNEVGMVDVEIPHVTGTTVRRRWLDIAEDGLIQTDEAPRPGRSSARMLAGLCRAKECSLAPRGRLERTIRARPMRGGGDDLPDLRVKNEGTLAMHLWMKYDYAK